MDVVRKSIKDFVEFVSGTVRVVERKVREFARRPKRKDRVAMGAVLTSLIEVCVMRYGLEEQIEHDETAPVDFVWEELSFGWECKRYDRTWFSNAGGWIASLRSQVLNRFPMQEIIIGKPIKYRALVCDNKKWEKQKCGKEVNNWLSEQGIEVLEVGSVKSPLERAKASMVFMAWFENMVSKICREGG